MLELKSLADSLCSDKTTHMAKLLSAKRDHQSANVVKSLIARPSFPKFVMHEAG